MKRTFVPLVLAAVLAIAPWWTACDEDDPTGPNDLGGDTNLELTEVGQEFPISIADPSGSTTVLSEIEDSIVIIARDNGIVTVRAVFGFDSAWVRGLEAELGMSNLPMSVKRAALTTYIERFGGVLDTTDKAAMTARVDAKLKVTSEGIQEFVSSGGDVTKPFTIVKYNANVGDKYEFTNSDGEKITRTVTYKSTTDDYQVGFWYLKVIKVEETREDPLVEKITYITNHKFGLVGVLLEPKAGNDIRVTVFPPTL